MITPLDFDLRLRERLDAADLTVTPEQGKQLHRYFELLAKWNQRLNLTALPLTDFPPSTLDRLFVEAIVASRLLPNSPIVVFDLGSGGGSPAIPLKIVRPAMRLTMVEVRERKAAFLREAIRELNLRDASVLTSRFEELDPASFGAVDAITVRALRLDAPFWTAVALLLKPEARLVLFGWKEGQGVDERFRVGEVVARPLTTIAVLQRR